VAALPLRLDRRLTLPMRHPTTIAERAAQLAADATPIADTGCLVCNCRWDAGGYGSLEIAGKHVKAHRVVWEDKHGPIPDGLSVLHACDVPSCINLDHLHLGTTTDNMREKVLRKRAKCWGVAQKLTVSAVREIRALYAAGGITQRELARTYGVWQTNISHVIIRRSWAHV
jgi:hypothetical protein